VGQGLEELREYAAGLWSAGLKLTHHRDGLKYLECGSPIIVEGTTFGQDASGQSWDGGTTRGGRLRSVFKFNGEGLIQRMYVYTDPDYTGADAGRIHWSRAKPRW
jgi:hypothetical protein